MNIHEQAADRLKQYENCSTKVARSGFTMTTEDYHLLIDLQHGLLSQGAVATKSQIMRAPLHALVAMGTVDCLEILNALPRLKQGRPAKQKNNRAAADPPPSNEPSEDSATFEKSAR